MKFVNNVLEVKSLAVIDIITTFSLTEISSIIKAVFDSEIISTVLSVISTTSALSSSEYNLIFGVPVNETPFPDYIKMGIRTVAYVTKGTVISNGSGTYTSPYKLK